MFLKSETHSVIFSSLLFSQPCSVDCSALYRQTLQPGRNLRTQQYHPSFTTCCFEHKYSTHTVQCGYVCSTVTASLRLQPIYRCGYSTVVVNLRLRPIYGCGHCAVAANLWLRPIYGYGQSTVAATLQLRPLYFVTMASLPISVTVLLCLDYMHYQSATLVQ